MCAMRHLWPIVVYSSTGALLPMDMYEMSMESDSEDGHVTRSRDQLDLRPIIGDDVEGVAGVEPWKRSCQSVRVGLVALGAVVAVMIVVMLVFVIFRIKSI